MRKRRIARAAWGVLVAVFSGAVVGAVVGGLGGRLAMRLTAVSTEGPPFTLTGNEVGVVTLDGTLSLVADTAKAGALAGLLYAAVRWALPSSHRALVFAPLVLLLLGGLFLSDTEFKLFDPPLLTAAFFLPLFPVFGLGLAGLVERVNPQPPKRWTRNGQIVVAAVAALGLAVMLRNLVELAY